MYTQSPAYYDLIYRDLKDYGEECDKIERLLQRFAPRPERILDVGCGTGEHARRLTQDHGYLVDGVDIQPAFIEIARSKLPAARFEIGDMRDFQLGRTYDTLLCLFSSIGYTETLEGLEQALGCFARHLNPGGWLICEPWVSPDLWQSGQVDSLTVRDPRTGEQITRTRSGQTEGMVSVLSIDYEIEGEGKLRQFSENHRLGLFTQEQMQAALDKTGFEANWLPHGLQSESLIVAQKS